MMTLIIWLSMCVAVSSQLSLHFFAMLVPLVFILLISHEKRAQKMESERVCPRIYSCIVDNFVYPLAVWILNISQGYVYVLICQMRWAIPYIIIIQDQLDCYQECTYIHNWKNQVRTFWHPLNFHFSHFFLLRRKTESESRQVFFFSSSLSYLLYVCDVFCGGMKMDTRWQWWWGWGERISLRNNVPWLWLSRRKDVLNVYQAVKSCLNLCLHSFSSTARHPDFTFTFLCVNHHYWEQDGASF